MAEPAPQPQTIMDNKYELIKPIGKGKFAVVHRAKRLSDESIVAVKKISVDSMDDKALWQCLISLSRGAAAISRHRCASSPGEQALGGLFVDFEAVPGERGSAALTASPRRQGESASRKCACCSRCSMIILCSTWILR